MGDDAGCTGVETGGRLQIAKLAFEIIINVASIPIRKRRGLTDDYAMVSVQICSNKRNRLLVSSNHHNEADARMEAELWVAANPHRRMEVVARLRLVDNAGLDREYLVVEDLTTTPPRHASPPPHNFGISRGDVVPNKVKAA